MAIHLSGIGPGGDQTAPWHRFRATRDAQASAPARSRFGPGKRRGAAVVEFAVIAPILFLLLLGMVDVGRALMVQNVITNAARDGARAASLDGATAADVETQVSGFLAGSNVPGANVTVTPNPLTSASTGDPVTVNIQVPYSSVSWLPSSFFFQGVTLDSSIVMRRETGQ